MSSANVGNCTLISEMSCEMIRWGAIVIITGEINERKKGREEEIKEKSDSFAEPVLSLWSWGMGLEKLTEEKYIMVKSNLLASLLLFWESGLKKTLFKPGV